LENNGGKFCKPSSLSLKASSFFSHKHLILVRAILPRA
jgi:hypothetical protein